MAATSLAQKTLAIETKPLQKASSIYRAINHSLRLKIMEIIHKAGSINVTPIVHQLKNRQSVISAHLKILRDAKIVTAEKKGSSVFYSINYQQVNRASVFAEKLIPYKTGVAGFVQNAERKLTIKSKETTVTFTPMELKVIRLVCEEGTSEEIAEKLGIGRRTVEDHRSNIIRKMKVRNSVGILFFAIKNGLYKI